jgi:hypothetical protein
MASLARATFLQVISLLLLVSLIAAKSARADDFTGMSHDDAKELLPPVQEAPPAPPPSYDVGFLPLPSWARGVVMPPLPDTLKPMGGKVAVLTTPPVAAPSLAPPKDSAPATVIVAKPTVVTPAPAPAQQNPALIAVSPFLDWIKANPQAAAEQARQQAGAYQAGSEATGAVAPNSSTPSGPIVVQPAAPYWMPPLIDSAPFGASSGGSSAAIYSTPQR